MPEQNASTLKLKIILAALETDTQALADEIGEQRPVLSDIINQNGRRHAKRARHKLADAINRKIDDLVLAKTEATS